MVPWQNWALTAMAICFLLTLFPPFIGGTTDGEQKFIGFHFLFGTPKWKSPKPQISRRSTLGDGGKEVVTETKHYPKHEYFNSRVDPVRYLLLIILTLLALGMIFIGNTRAQLSQEQQND